VVALGLFGVFTGVGCGSDPEKGSPDDSNVEPIAFDALGNEVAKARCAQVFNCCDATERDTLFGAADPKPTNESECVAMLAPVNNALFVEIKKSIEEGRQGYDGKKAALCVSKLGNECVNVVDGDWGQEPDCKATFVGKVADGDACTMDEDCSGGSKSSCYKGACRPLGTAGQACDYSDDCASDHCNVESVCAAKKANGQACTSGGDCASERCDFNTSMCAEKVAEGAACAFSDECKTGNCEKSVCAAKRADGAACSSDWECQSDSCDFKSEVCTPEQKLSCDGN
jgi:hypothetical protein